MNRVNNEIIKLKKDFYKINTHFNKLIKDEKLLNKPNFLILIEKLKKLVVLISNKLLNFENENNVNINEIKELKQNILLLNNYYNLIYQYKYCN